MGYVSGRVACREIGVHPNTLRNWAKAGLIRFVWTKTGYRRYDLGSIIKPKYRRGKRVVYARVSSHKQKDDLERQEKFLRGRYPQHEVITDIGSGLNFRRKGLRAILELAMSGNLKELVVAHRDRLCRFGFELIRWIIEKHGGRLVVLDTTACSPEQELTQDLISIIHVFGCRVNGLRAYSHKIKKDTNLSR